MSKPAMKVVSAAVLSGSYEKKDLAAIVGGGTLHVHSTASGDPDPLALVTQAALADAKIPHYMWEVSDSSTLYRVPDSASRTVVIQNILGSAGLKRYVQERAQIVLEELLTNAIYHSYRNPEGRDKYGRKDLVKLTDKEVVEVRASSTAEGLYLAVQDRGGSLRAEDLQNVFSRCYGPAEKQIESKDGGAGLGLYMVFEQVTHMKVTAQPGVGTEIAVWIASRSTFDPKVFTFNFFQRR